MIRSSLKGSKDNPYVGIFGVFLAVIELAVKDYKTQKEYKDSNHKWFNEYLFKSAVRFLTGSTILLYLEILSIDDPERFRNKILKELGLQ